MYRSKLTKTIHAVMLTLWFGLLCTGVVAQHNSPPYIHYHSHLHGGLIIERADGSDSRLLRDVGSGEREWSASGAWFTVGDEMISSTDGTQNIPYPQHPESYNDFLHTQWSPTDDVLLVTLSASDSSSIRSQIYDVATQTILADFNVSFSNLERPYPISQHWSSDGEKAYIFWRGTLITLYRDGSHHVLQDESFRQFHQGRIFSANRDESSNNPLAILNIETGKRYEIGDDSGWPITYPIISWSPTLDYALIYAPSCRDESCDSSLRLFNWHTREVDIINLVIPFLEEKLDCQLYYTYNPQCANIWSGTGRYAALWDRENNIYVIDVVTKETFSLKASDRYYYKWTPDEKLLIYDGDIHRFDPETGEETTVDMALGGFRHDFSVSPDSNHIGFSGYPPVVTDRDGTIIFQTIEHSYSTGSNYPQYAYQWHSSGEWAIADYRISFSGGGGGPLASVVFDLAGTTRRELPTGGRSSFLPEHAIPHLAPGQSNSLKTDPIYTLVQEGDMGVGWHPTDPNQLVTYSREAGLIFWSLDETPQIIRHVIPKHPFPSAWPYGLKLFWLPERDVVAFSIGLDIYVMDDETGESIIIDSVSYSMIEELLLDHLTNEDVADSDIDFSRLGFEPSSDFASVIVWNRDMDNQAYVVDIVNRQVIPISISESAFSADVRNDIVVVGSVYDCCFYVKDSLTGELIDRFYGTALSIALSADGRWLATTSQGMTSIWDMSKYSSDD